VRDNMGCIEMCSSGGGEQARRRDGEGVVGDGSAAVAMDIWLDVGLHGGDLRWRSSVVERSELVNEREISRSDFSQGQQLTYP
jgi:hypothetical protein